MTILHVIFSPRIAGSERYCIDLANGQAAMGHKVHVLGSRGSPVEAELSPLVRFHGLGTRFLRGFRTRRIARAIGADIVHAHLSPACKALRQLSGGPVRIATLHVGYKARQHRHLDGLVCINRQQRDVLDGYAGKSVLVPNWLPDASARKPYGLRQKLALPADAVIVGSVGRLHRSKGCDVLIAAFRKAAPDNAVLVIAGDGPERQALADLAGGDRRIHFIGHCGNVPGFLDEIDLFVSPSREETAGIAILEAMRSGLPVITTATQGPLDYLRDFPVTFVGIDAIDEMATALRHALSNMSTGSRERMQYDMTPFDRGAGIARIVDFYMSFASRSVNRKS